jgi:hypothetical protein
MPEEQEKRGRGRPPGPPKPAKIKKRMGRPPGSPKPPGSGRKKGTPNKTTLEIKEMAMAYAPGVIKMFGEMATDMNRPDDIRQRAGRELLDRGIGKAPQALNLGGHDGGPLNLELLTDEQLSLLADRIDNALQTFEAAFSSKQHKGEPEED